MNWVGGARSRIKRENEWKKQKEFFQWKRFLVKQNTVHGHQQMNSGRRSQDLKALMAVDKAFSAKHSAASNTDHGFRGNRRRRDIERLNLDKFQPKRGYTEVHLPPSPSPNVGTSLTGMHNVYSINKLNKADGLKNTNFLTRRSQKILPRLGKDHLFTYETTSSEVPLPLPSWPHDVLSKCVTPPSGIRGNSDDHILECINHTSLAESKIKAKTSDLDLFQTTPLNKHCFSNPAPVLVSREEDNQIVPFSSRVVSPKEIEASKTISRGFLKKPSSLKGKTVRGKFTVHFSDEVITNDITCGKSSKLEIKNLERPSPIKKEKTLTLKLSADMSFNDSSFRYPEKKHSRDQEICNTHTQQSPLSNTFHPKFKKEFNFTDQMCFCNTRATNCSCSANISWEPGNNKQIRNSPETEKSLLLKEDNLLSCSVDRCSVADSFKPLMSNSATSFNGLSGHSGEDKSNSEELPFQLDTSCLKKEIIRDEDVCQLSQKCAQHTGEPGWLVGQNSSPHVVPKLSAPCATSDYLNDHKEELHKFNAEVSLLQTYNEFKASLTKRDEDIQKDVCRESLRKHGQKDEDVLDMDHHVTYVADCGGVHTGEKTQTTLADEMEDVIRQETFNPVHDQTGDVSAKSTDHYPVANTSSHGSEEVGVISATTQTDIPHCDAYTSCDIDFRHMSTQWDPLDFKSPPFLSTPSQSNSVTTKPCMVKVEIMDISTVAGLHEDANFGTKNKNVYSLRPRRKID